MKIQAQRADAFVQSPDSGVHAMLLYGPDAGLVRERAAAAAKATVPDVDDPFQVSDLDGDALRKDGAALADAAASVSLLGGRRLVRIRGAGDAVAGVFEAWLPTATDAALVVVEASDLPPRSKLRALFEAAKNAAAVPCYADDAASLPGLIRGDLAARGLDVERDALEYLAGHLGSDRMTTRAELEKLALYKGDGDGSVTLADAMAVVGDNAALSVDAVVFAAGNGDPAALEAALARAVAEGVAVPSLMRATLGHLQRLHLVRGLVDAGQPLDQAVKSLRPRVFFKLERVFCDQVRRWSQGRLAQAMSLMLAAEADTKSSGMPDDAIIASRALHRVAQAGRAARR